MTTSATVIMICACVIIFVLIGIAVILTIDIYRRLEVFEELEKRVKNAIKTVVELNKLKNELEEEIFKYKLIRETKEERKHGNRILDNSNNINTIHSNESTSNSSNDNSDTNDNNNDSREDNKNS